MYPGAIIMRALSTRVLLYPKILSYYGGVVIVRAPVLRPLNTALDIYFKFSCESYSFAVSLILILPTDTTAYYSQGNKK